MTATSREPSVRTLRSHDPPDTRSMSVADLKAALREKDVDISGCTEKRELEALLAKATTPEQWRFPPDGITYRGGKLPDEHRAFYTVGKKYRVPGFLASTFSRDVAVEFRDGNGYPPEAPGFVAKLSSPPAKSTRRRR